ncbi:polymorphic toxin-type HINT domain-containing protein, partial [Streptomyces sp. NPDC055815]
MTRATGDAELAGARPGTAVRAGTLPLWVEPAAPHGKRTPAVRTASPARVTVVRSDDKAARAAGVDGLLFALSAPAAESPRAIRVGIDVDALRSALGADFASRGRLVALPACAATTPAAPSCRVRTPLVARYDKAADRLTAEVRLPAAPATSPGTARRSTVTRASYAVTTAATGTGAFLLAAETGASGGGGTYAATNLSPSSGWTAGGASGALTYGYPVQMPPGLGGAVPAVALGYNSSAVDGKTSATNAQASWIGDGWDYNPGFIERSYKPCDRAGIAGSGDLCWGGFNATLSFGDRSGSLVRDKNAGTAGTSADAATGVWRLKDDDGSRIEFLSGADNGAHDGVHAKLTDSSGTVYYFGANHLPGGDGSDPATKSVSTVPVYAPNSGDPCHDTAKGKASWCQMWQRLSLDYSVDPRGNLTTYTWAPEINYYARGGGQNNGDGTRTAYTRATTVASLAYGQRLPEQIAAKGALQPAARVLFTTQERCLAGGTACDPVNRTVANKGNWPDVPVDQECKDTGACTNYGPTYFSTRRLTAVTTQVRVGGVWQDVDSYALTHSFPDPKDNSSQKALWLDSVQRTGHTANPAVSLPPVSFTPVMLPNRVDGTDLVPAPPLMNRPRIQQIRNETGGVLNVDYNLPDCSRVNHVMPAGEDDNTRSCYPVRWTPPGSVAGADPVLDWFNRYTVKSLTENDTATDAPQRITAYTYGPAGWHRDDSKYTDPKARTWGEFRGFATVTTTVGTGTDGPKSQSRTTFRQGMHGDVRKDGSTRDVQLVDAIGRTTPDAEWLAGQSLQTETFDQAGGKVIQQTVGTATGDVVTATQGRGDGLPDLTARYNATVASSTSRALKADGTWRAVTRTTTRDAGHANRTVSTLEQADGLPDACERVSYADGSATGRQDLISERLTVSGPDACTATPTAANTLNRNRILYDGRPHGQSGTTSLPTSGEVLERYEADGTAVFTTVNTTAYDAYGRPTSSTEPASTDLQHPGGKSDSTSYRSDAPGELPTSTVYSAAAPGVAGATWDTVNTFDSRRALPLTAQDPNGRTVVQRHDALGRLTQVWTAGRSPESTPNADTVYSYATSNQTGVPSTVTTATLKRDGETPVYTRKVDLLDGFGRTRQSQATPANPAYTGRMVSDTRYDSQGRVERTSNTWYNDQAAPGGTLLTAADSAIPSQTRNAHDGMGRITASEFWSLGVKQHATVTSYPGADRTDIVPPPGAWPAGTITDARGRVTERWQYRTPTATGNPADADISRYTFTVDGKPLTRKDAGGNTWTFGYDVRGRQISGTDPDAGATTRTYDTASRLVSSKDARGTNLVYTYDLLGRRTGLYDGAVTSGKQLVRWTYDTVAKGKLASSTRFVGGASGQQYTRTVLGYDDGYRETGSKITLPGTDVGQAAGTTFTYT